MMNETTHDSPARNGGPLQSRLSQLHPWNQLGTCYLSSVSKTRTEPVDPPTNTGEKLKGQLADMPLISSLPHLVCTKRRATVPKPDYRGQL